MPPLHAADETIVALPSYGPLVQPNHVTRCVDSSSEAVAVVFAHGTRDGCMDSEERERESTCVQSLLDLRLTGNWLPVQTQVEARAW